MLNIEIFRYPKTFPTFKLKIDHKIITFMCYFYLRNNREKSVDDPQVGLSDVDKSRKAGTILYTGNRLGDDWAKSLRHNGANVFIRKLGNLH